MVRAATAAQLRVVRCRTGGGTFALDLAAVRGVERADRMTPGAGEWPHVGELHARGGGVPVLSLAGLLGLPETVPTPADQLVLTDAAGSPLALLVEAVSPVADVPAGAVHPLPRHAAAPGYRAVIRSGDELVPWLCPTALLGGGPAAGVPFAAPPFRRTPAAPRADRLLLLPLTDDADGPPWLAAVPAALVEETLGAGRTVAVPGAAGFVRGLRAWQDGVIAVLDLAAWAGLPGVGDDPTARVVVVRLPGTAEPVGLLVRRGVRMVKLPLPHLESTRPFPGGAAGLAGAVETDAGPVALLNFGGLVGDCG